MFGFDDTGFFPAFKLEAGSWVRNEEMEKYINFEIEIWSDSPDRKPRLQLESKPSIRRCN